MKRYIGNCVDNPFENVELLLSIIDNAKEIKKNTFLKACDVDKETQKQMRKFPRDYSYQKNGNVYFYVWSAIEYFYR